MTRGGEIPDFDVMKYPMPIDRLNEDREWDATWRWAWDILKCEDWYERLSSDS